MSILGAKIKVLGASTDLVVISLFRGRWIWSTLFSNLTIITVFWQHSWMEQIFYLLRRKMTLGTYKVTLWIGSKLVIMYLK